MSSEIGGTPQYNGNISWMTDYMQGMSYQDPIDLFNPTSTVGYSYNYDNANRLTKATFGFYSSPGGGNYAWEAEGSYNMPTITYDNDGNINNLERNGSGTGAMDNLYYYYTSGTDRLTQFWNQVNNVTSTYSYDSNGNIISDDHNSIAFTLYDIYNEPVEVFKTNGTEYTFGGVYPAFGGNVNGARIFKNPGGGSSYVFYANDPSGKTEAVHREPYSSNVDYNIWANGDNIAQVRYTYYDSYSRYYYLKDHLGDISMIINQNGGVDSYNNYYPFGEQMAGSGMNQAGSADGRYKFTGKELDAETGLNYFGDRYYDSWSGRWYTLDPMGIKYPSWSGYSYCLDNPTGNVDPQGDTVWVSYGDEKVLYTTGMEYTGKNSTIASIISSLNSMNSTVNGAKVLTTLMSSNGNYDYTIGSKDVGDFVANKSGLGGTMNLDAKWNGEIEEVAHESFHGYMYDQGSGLSSVTNEVEAYLFGKGVSMGVGLTTETFGPPRSAYQSAMVNLLESESFNKGELDQAVKFFKAESYVNKGHKYDTFHNVQPQEKFLIKQFFPLWR